MRALLGAVVENYEPIAWAEELIEPARAVDHPRLAFLYVMASQCYMTGRIEAAVGYSDAGQIGSRQRAARRCRSASKACLALRTWPSASPNGGSSGAAPSSHAAATPTSSSGHAWFSHWRSPVRGEEAMAAANGLIEAAEATGNPYVLSFALCAYGYAFRDADPVRALDALRRGLVIAQDSGNRSNETHLAASLARLEAEHGDTAVRARSPHSGDPQLPRRGQHHRHPHPAGCPRRSFRPARTLRTGGHHRRFRAQPPHRSVASPKSTPRSPTCAMSSATRPTNRSPARARR